MRILDKVITAQELKQIAGDTFDELVKAVVDIQRELMAVDAELHADLETLLLEDGSSQKDLWGINFYPDLKGDEFIEFDSMINMRPSQGNKSRGVDDVRIRDKIIAVVNKWIKQ